MARKDALLRLTTRLMARRDALRKALNGDLDSFRKFSELSVVGDNVDAAVDSANDEICSQLVEIESRELGQIEHALRRIAAGVYGRCEFCGGKISEARLNALPYTNSCIDCQRENERAGQSRALEPDSKRWAKIYDKPAEEGESDSQINLSDFEMDFSESGRGVLGHNLPSTSIRRRTSGGFFYTLNFLVAKRRWDHRPRRMAQSCAAGGTHAGLV
jgi:DnaK suppressor protein